MGLTPEEYKPLLDGTKILSLAESKKAMTKAEGLGSVYGSTQVSDAFNVKYGVYKESQAVDSYIDPSIIMGL